MTTDDSGPLPDLDDAPAGPDWLEEGSPPDTDNDPPPRLRVAPDVDDPRPEIRISLEFHETVSETIAALAGMRVNGTAEPHGIGDPKMFQRSLELVSVARYVPPPGKEAFVAKGQPVIFPIAQPTLQTRLSQYARFFRRAKVTAKEKALIAHGVKPEESWDRCLAPPNVMQAVLAAKEWPGIRPLVGVTETPMLRPDGTLAVPRKDRAEYDWSTGYLLVPGLDVPAIPAEPTQSDAKKALRILLEPFLDFPFAEESHRMVPIAAILTMLARAAIGGAVPGFVFDAATRGSGKTKQCDVVSLVALGRHAARATFPSNDDELEKMLSAYAIAGTPLILLDNVTRPFGGGPVDKVLTAEDCVDLRILGKSEIRTLVWRAILLVSGNNMAISEDTLRRVLVSRLESKLESPERRADFRHADLLGWVREHRTRLVAAALTILRAYCCIGRPTTDCELDMGFAAWNRLIPHAIRFAGGVDVMLARPRGEAAMTDEMGALGTFLRELPRLSDHPLTSRGIVDALWPAGGRDPDQGPDGWEDMRAAIELLAPQRTAHVTQAQRANALGKHLRKSLARVIRGKMLREGWDANGNRTWRVELPA